MSACGDNTRSIEKEYNTESEVVDFSTELIIESESNDNELTDIERTTNSIKPYIDVLGTELDADGMLSVQEEFFEGLSSVYVMGRTGSVSHGLTDVSDTQIRLMEWIDNEESTEEDFEKYVEAINSYIGSLGTEKSYDNISDKTYLWVDHNNRSYLLCWFEDNHINLRWDYSEDVLPIDEAFASLTTSSETKNQEPPKADEKPIDNGNVTTMPSSTQWFEVTDDDDRNICWALSKEAVLKNLKSPTSAKFPFSYNSSDVSIMVNGNMYAVISIVDADNAFGANIRATTLVTIEKSGSTFTVIECIIE